MKPSINSGISFQQIAVNTTQNDIPTLIELLKSPLLLEPVANDFKLDYWKLKKRITITTGGDQRNWRDEAEGVIIVSILGGNTKKDKNLLEEIKSVYLDSALQQRQKKLSDGLTFLNKQAPELRRKTEEIQSSLKLLREEYSLIEPLLEGKNLKNEVSNLENLIRRIKSDISLLKQVKRNY